LRRAARASHSMLLFAGEHITGVCSWCKSRGQARRLFTKAKQPAALKRPTPFLGLIDPAQDFSPVCEGQILAKRAAGLSPALCQIVFQKLHCGIGATGLMRHVAKGKPHFHAAQSANHHQIVEIPQMANSKHFSSQV
jgi:hypothetical protein